LERWCDEFGDSQPTLRSFILPGGTVAGGYLHLARTICRRAERAAWRATADHGSLAGDDAPDDGPVSSSGINPQALTYLNRLSDLLFILSRTVNGVDQEILWLPEDQR
jgi:cob(I)alamin adenosyltransferase